MAGQQRIYRLTMYREVPYRLITYRYTLYVRSDLLPLLNGLRY